MHTPLGPGGEFDHIRAFLGEWGDIAQGIGDDAALLTPLPGQQLVVSTDATVEDVHFRRSWISPRDLGRRAASAALSDLAAMGARADSVLVSLVAPESWLDHLREFAAGLKHSVGAAQARIVGGNLSNGHTFSCTLTVLGYTHRPVRRSGGLPGDFLYVTGTLGGPKVALEALERGEQPPDWALRRFLHPEARLAEGHWLAEQGAHAMIDVSDGLASDARHLGAASGVRATVNSSLVPRFSDVTPADALTSGEEYELLVALPSDTGEQIAAAFVRQFGLPLTHVGQLDKPGGEGAASVHDRSNSSVRVEIAGGHDHFSTR